MRDWFNRKLFNAVHTQNLIYNTCWEDPRVDREALEFSSDSSVVVITSAGCNALDYMIAGAGAVHAVDMNPRQNALLELKIAAAQALSYEEYFEWFGRGRGHDAERVYAQRIRQFLPNYAQRIWDLRIGYFCGAGWRPSLYFRGTSGFFARIVNSYLDRFVRARDVVMQMLDAPSLAEQQRLYFEELKPRFWGRGVRWCMDRSLTLALLGVPAAQRRQIEKYSPDGISGFVERCLDAVFGKLPLSENYFWRVYLTGEYSSQCCPEYLTQAGYWKIRTEARQRVRIHTGSLLQFLRSNGERHSHFVLLDHMDWLNARLRPVLEAEWQEIFDNALPGARIIWRSGGSRTEFVDTVPVKVRGRYSSVGEWLRYDPGKAARLHELDRVHTYGSFYIADICAA